MLAAGALLAAQAGMRDAAAQTPNADDRLFRSRSDADPNNPTRLRSGGGPTDARIGGTDFDYRPGTGAGQTGFDSTNRRSKAKPKAKQSAKPPGNSAPSSTASAGLPPLPSTRPTAALPPGAVPASATVARATQSLERRGGPNYIPGSAGPPLETEDPAALPPPQVTPTRRAPPDPAPFDPIGIPAGVFTLHPALDVVGGYDTNATRTLSKGPSWFESVAGELLVNSNWERHALNAALRGNYAWFNEARQLDRPAFDGRVDGRVDVSSDTRLNLQARYIVATDYPGSPNVQAGLSKFPISTTLGGTVGFEQRFNRLEIAVRGLVDRTVFQDSQLTDGSTDSNEDRNLNRYATEMRLAYELSPAFKPFVEGGVDTRQHDLAMDRNGFKRNSDGFFGRAGSAFEISRIFTGDLAVGWVMRSYKDPSLPDLSGVTVDGSLTWVMSALTTVKIAARTVAGESTLAGTAGVLTREAGIQVDHAFRQWLIGTLRFTYDNDDYVGSTRKDDRFAAAAVMTYKLNREMHLRGEYRREWLRSSIGSANYLSNVWLLGLRLQK